MFKFKNGFILAGLANIGGVLLFSRFFTNEIMNSAYPVVMSNFGLLMIVIWGLAYISIASSYESVPYLSLVFCIEKLTYVLTWIFWFLNHDLNSIYSKDIFAGLFYTVYGFNDFVFMIFFGFVFMKVKFKSR